MDDSGVLSSLPSTPASTSRRSWFAALPGKPSLNAINTGSVCGVAGFGGTWTTCTCAAAAPAQVQVVHVPPKPATPHTEPVLMAFSDGFPGSAANQERREVDAGVDGKLERTPESSIDLHQHLAAGQLFTLALDHGDALPAQRVEEAKSWTSQPRVQRDAFAVHAEAARRRLLPQTAVGKQRDCSVTPTQCEKALTHPCDTALQQHGERRSRDGRERPSTGCRVRNGCHGRPAARPADGHN